LDVRGEDECRADVVAGPNELLEPPPENRLRLCLVDQFELGRGHWPPPSFLSRLQGHSSASSGFGSAHFRSRADAPKVWVPATNGPGPRYDLARTSGEGRFALDPVVETAHAEIPVGAVAPRVHRAGRRAGRLRVLRRVGGQAP